MAFAVRAQPLPDTSTTSASKQFIVSGPRQTATASTVARASGLMFLDPPLVAVTCESIKQALERELGWTGDWAHRIHVVIHPVRFDNEEILLTAFRTPAGWSYQIATPDAVAPHRLLTAVVEALLRERANREVVERSVELPPWLAAGLAEHLGAGPAAHLAVMYQRSQTRQSNSREALARLRAHLQDTAVLNVDALNWPEEGAMAGAAAEHYRDCAHLFVRELLRLRGGASLMNQMLSLLSEQLNWQTAFLRAFEPNFRTLLDVEKWWSLTVFQFTGEDPGQPWSLGETRERLEEILFTSVAVRISDAELPHTSSVSLKTILEDWSFERQVPLLNQKCTQLSALRQRAAAPAAALVEEYRQVLTQYLNARTAPAPEKGRQVAGITPRVALTSAVRALQQLDVQRRNLAKTAEDRPVRDRSP